MGALEKLEFSAWFAAQGRGSARPPRGLYVLLPTDIGAVATRTPRSPRRARRSSASGCGIARMLCRIQMTPGRWMNPFPSRCRAGFTGFVRMRPKTRWQTRDATALAVPEAS